MSLWLESTTEAHPFIDASYWQANEAVVRDEYLPAAETWVWEENGTLCGFISVMQFQFVGALFVARRSSEGDWACAAEPRSAALPVFNLEVYQKNVRAVNFYHAQGFRIEDSAWQDDTQHPTWIMSWQADQTP